jgi:hypothetical protein
MKKQKAPKKLALSKETLRNLYNRELQEVAGGAHSAGQVTKCSVCPGCTL